MERQSNVHNPRLDDELAHEVESLTRGAPTEARTDPSRTMEDADDGEPVPEALISVGTEPDDPIVLGHDEVRARSELAIHLLPSRFPMTRDEVLGCATAQQAPAGLLASLDRLPVGRYENVEQVWESLGGRREQRTRHEPEPDQGSGGRRPETSVQSRSPATRHEQPSAVEEYDFRFDLAYRIVALPFGVHPGNAAVCVDERTEPAVLQAHFGPWRVTTPVGNVVATRITGPYAALKTVGPAHVSLADGGLTFATNGRRGLCISFREPVRGLEPLGVVRHRSLTVTVDDAEGLQSALARAADPR
jgi:hypothetical protein